MAHILAWVLATELAGLAILPPLRAFFGNRRDAALLSRPIGLAAVAYLGWVLSLATTFGFRRATLLLALAAIGAGGLLLRRRATEGSPARADWWGDEEKLAALLFWGASGVFLLIRSFGPAILGAEKFMDLAFLNSLARYPAMPPGDPWMAGKTINYYYWGYLLAAAQAKLSGVPPLTAFNLAIATFAGSSFAAAACLGLRLSGGRLGVGLGAGFGAVFAGNLTGALDAWAAPFAADFDYWHASRVIGPENFKTINEFPFFTFFHADLHPHLLAFPYFIAAFAVAQRWIERGREAGWGRELPGMLLVALVAGTARSANFWNLPALAILLVVGGAFRTTRGVRLPSLPGAILGALEGAGVLVGALVLFLPYTMSFYLAQRGLGRATMFSGVLEFLGMWALLFLVLLLGLWPRGPEDSEAARQRRGFGLAIAAGVSVFAALLSGRPAMALVLLLSFLAAAAAWRALRSATDDPGGVYAALLVLLGLGMVGGCEFIYFKDTYGQDLQRMNTIFKFYHQAWPLLAIGAAVFAGRALDAAPRSRALRAGLALPVVLACLWPINVSVSRFRQKDGPLSLDAHGPLVRRNKGDAAAIDWLLKKAPMGSVVMEASGDPYSEFARISSHTGIPTVMGWANHEGLWRSDSAEVEARKAQVKLFYTTPNAAVAAEILQRYGVTHVVIGDMERRTYGSNPALAEFPFLYPKIISEGTAVYEVARPR
jgi:YYY domain-containing protein